METNNLPPITDDEQLFDFCTRTNTDSTTCPKDPNLSRNMSSCSYFVSNNNGGNLCRKWANMRPDKADEAKKVYCDKFDTNDCLCLNRKENDIYKELNEVVNPSKYDDYFDDKDDEKEEDVKATCWWAPCRNPKSFVMFEKDIREANKKQTISCDVFNQYFSQNPGSSITKSQAETYIDCTGNIDFTNGVSPGTSQDSSASGSGKLFDRYNVFIILIIILIAILLGWGFIKAITDKKNKKVDMAARKYLSGQPVSVVTSEN